MIIVQQEFLDTLCSLPRACIYALVNEIDKKVWLTHTNDVIVSLNRNMREIQNNTHKCKDDYRKLSIVILEECNTDNKLLKYSYWNNEYRKLGYTNYRKYKSIEYKVRTNVDCFNSLVLVKLVNRGNKEIVVGVFDTLKEAKSFIKDYYDTQGELIHQIIYSQNELTIKWINESKEVVE